MERKNRKTLTSDLVRIIRNMLEAGCNVNEIATSLSLSSRTVRNLRKKIEAGEEFVLASKKRKTTYEERNRMFNSINQLIFNIVSCNHSFTQNEIRNIVQDQMDVSISRQTIGRKLEKLNFTRKRLSLIPEERNSEEKIDARAIYAADISRFPKEDLVFLDETGFNLHTRRSYGYSPVNTKAYITAPANRTINRSSMCAISVNGVVAYDYKTSGYNVSSFVNFINDKLSLHFKANPNNILIMDNCPFHKLADVKNALLENNIVYKYTVPYSPQLNPIEEFFAMLKSKYCSLKIEKPNLAIEEILFLLLDPNGPKRNVYLTDCQEYYRNMDIWLDKARRHEAFY